MKLCARLGCTTEFQPRTLNQKYCCSYCASLSWYDKLKVSRAKAKAGVKANSTKESNLFNECYTKTTVASQIEELKQLYKHTVKLGIEDPVVCRILESVTNAKYDLPYDSYKKMSAEMIEEIKNKKEKNARK